MQALMDRIACYLHEGGEWCSLHKAHTLAALICSTRPTSIVEIGVWMGGSLIPMAMACKEVGIGTVYGIDPWNTEASTKDMGLTDANWWRQVDHEKAYQHLLERISRHELDRYVVIARSKSDDVDWENGNIDLLHIDGNHSEQAYRDVLHFAPSIPVGGYVIMDDVHWVGGGVLKGVEHLLETGFIKKYDLDSGSVFQRNSLVI